MASLFLILKAILTLSGSMKSMPLVSVLVVGVKVLNTRMGNTVHRAATAHN